MDSFSQYAGHPDYAQSLIRARNRFIAGRAASLKDVKDVYQSAAGWVRQDIAALTTAGPLRSGHFRALATNLERRAGQFNTQVLQVIQKGIWDASGAGVSGPANVAARMVGNFFPPHELKTLFAGINERAVMAMLARTRVDGLMLSDRVWKAAGIWRNATTRLVEDGIVRGLDSRKLAREVQQYLQPDVWTAQKHEVRKRVGIPKNVSYEGMRLARTELNNAFLEGQIAANQGVPGYRGIYWRLSDAHPAPDICDDMAGNMFHGEPGFYPRGEEPTRPHPQCMCVPVSAFEEPGAFVDRLRSWQRDPGSQPDIEEWHQSTGGMLRRP